MKKYILLIILLLLISNCTSVHFVPPSPENFNIGEFGEQEKIEFAKEDTIAVVFILTIRENNDDKIIATVGTALDEIKSSTISYIENKKYSILPLYVDIYEKLDRHFVPVKGDVDNYTFIQNFRTFEQIDTLSFQPKYNFWAISGRDYRLQQYETFRSSMISDIIIKYEKYLQKANVQYALFLDITLENIIKETSYTQSTARGFAVYGNKKVLTNRFRWKNPNLTILDDLNNKYFTPKAYAWMEANINSEQTNELIGTLLGDIPAKK